MNSFDFTGGPGPGDQAGLLRAATQLAGAARALGCVITIRQQSIPPFASGRRVDVVEVRGLRPPALAQSADRDAAATEP